MKDRPCADVMAIMDQDGEWEVLVLPITHSPPPNLADAIEIPTETKNRLGLDTDRSWIMVTHQSTGRPATEPVEIEERLTVRDRHK
jgi:hypothetical protein